MTTLDTIRPFAMPYAAVALGVYLLGRAALQFARWRAGGTLQGKALVASVRARVALAPVGWSGAAALCLAHRWYVAAVPSAVVAALSLCLAAVFWSRSAGLAASVADTPVVQSKAPPLLPRWVYWVAIALAACFAAVVQLMAEGAFTPAQAAVAALAIAVINAVAVMALMVCTKRFRTHQRPTSDDGRGGPDEGPPAAPVE